jgi:hypothetical protein
MSFPVDHMNEIMTVYPKSGNGAYGPVFGADFEEICYLEPGFKLVTDSQGAEVVSSLFGIYGPECAVKVGDEASWDGKRYAAIAVDKLRFDGETHHVEIYWKSVAG